MYGLSWREEPQAQVCTAQKLAHGHLGKTRKGPEYAEHSGVEGRLSAGTTPQTPDSLPCGEGLNRRAWGKAPFALA